MGDFEPQILYFCLSNATHNNSARWTPGHYGPSIGSRPLGIEWSHDRWRHVTPKDQTRNPIIFEALYLRRVPGRRMVTMDHL